MPHALQLLLHNLRHLCSLSPALWPGGAVASTCELDEQHDAAHDVQLLLRDRLGQLGALRAGLLAVQEVAVLLEDLGDQIRGCAICTTMSAAGQGDLTQYKQGRGHRTH